MSVSGIARAENISHPYADDILRLAVPALAAVNARQPADTTLPALMKVFSEEGARHHGSWRVSKPYSFVSQRLAMRQATVNAGLKTLPTS
ncbi:MAG: hypothetical protein JWP20_2038 [Roseomonas sp.]|nr:hypothetical protein [Roseomonas sp.]